MTLIQKLTIGQSENRLFPLYFLSKIWNPNTFFFISQNLKINNFWKKKKEGIALLTLTNWNRSPLIWKSENPCHISAVYQKLNVYVSVFIYMYGWLGNQCQFNLSFEDPLPQPTVSYFFSPVCPLSHPFPNFCTHLLIRSLSLCLFFYSAFFLKWKVHGCPKFIPQSYYMSAKPSSKSVG